MKALRHSRRLHRRHQKQARNATLNLVPMIDVFAILVFFLLSNASSVFARLHRLDLRLPAPAAATINQEDPGLRVVLRRDSLQVSDRNGPQALLPRKDGEHDLAALSQLMQRLKQSHPATRNVVLLLEPDAPYDDLIQVMDAVRIAPSRVVGTPGVELFPDIALGDAPAGAPLPAAPSP